MNAIPFAKILPLWFATLIAAICQMAPMSAGTAQEQGSEQTRFMEMDVHTYTAASSHFEDVWSLYKEKDFLLKGKEEGIVLEREGLLGYVATGGALKAICMKPHKNYALILVHFAKEQRDDVVIAVTAKNELSSKFLVSLVVSIPEMVDEKLRREGYPIRADHSIDSAVFHRDYSEFFEALSKAVFINWLE